MPTSFGVAKRLGLESFRDPAVTYGDFFVFNHIVTTGADLDIRASILTPSGTNGVLGWGRDNVITYGTRTIAYWGGDNTGVGQESIYIDRTQFQLAFPSATSIELDLRCFWNAVTGTNVIINMDAYQGGAMQQDGNYGFENPTAINSFPASKSIIRGITFQSSNVETDGQRHSRVIIDFAAETLTYFAN